MRHCALRRALRQIWHVTQHVRWRIAQAGSHERVDTPLAHSNEARCTSSTSLLYRLAVPELNRRSLMMMTGVGALAAALPIPEAGALPASPPAAPPPTAQTSPYIFHD